MTDRTQVPEASLGVGTDNVKERALEFAATAREQWTGATRTLRDYIVKEPTRALGLALGMGVLLGWLIKRR
ncbi:DUF883 family protein [Tundrisphaera lichenicola]|uniref:DUF883 family protein n=1 Tax=Tundrisphaera lichenicola TaxID=2029860 RepID=UPI003EBA1911